MNALQRIKLERKKGWRLSDFPGESKKVTRGKTLGWGNPFPVTDPKTKEKAAKAVELYRDALLSGKLDYTVADVRRELAGKNLACFCKLDWPCHADVLMEVANGR